MLKDVSSLKIGDEKIEEETKIGLVKDIFENEDEIQDAFKGKTSSIQEFFESLENEVKEYYK